MKTIEERAKECVRHLTQGWVLEAAGDQLEALFIAGAESERAELTRWNDPKEVLPIDSRWVLVRVKCDVAPYRIARYFEEEKDVSAYWYVLNCPEASADFVIGWREIYE